MAAINPILAQKLGLTQAPPVAQDAQPATPMRQMRCALARAADQAAGLWVSVLGISEEDLDAENLIEGAPEGWVVLGLRDGLSAGLTGCFYWINRCDLPWLKCKRWAVCCHEAMTNAASHGLMP
jgi:flagellar motor switch protein FliM